MDWIKTDGKIVIPGILMMLVMGSVYSYSVFRLPIENYFDISSSQSGIPYMLSLFFYALFMGIGGKILEKVHLYKVMLLGVFFISFGWLIAYFGKAFMILSLGYGVFIGTGIGLIYGVPLMVITNYFPNKKGRYLGLVLLGFGLSPLISAPILQYFVESSGLHLTFLYMSGFTVIVLGILTYFYKGYQNRSQELIPTKFFDTLQKREYMLLYAVFFLATFIGLSVIGFSSTYAYNVFKYSLERAAFLVSLFAIFNGFGRVLFGYLSDVLKLVTIMIISFVSLLLSTGSVLLFPSSSVVFIIAFSIIWMNLGGWLAIAPAATSKLFGPTEYSRNYGFLFSAYGFSALIGVYVTGTLIDLFNNYQATFIVFFGLSCLGIVVTYLFKQTIKS